MIDLDDKRLEAARRLGATQTINSNDGKAAEKVRALTAERGVDTAIEAVGVPATFLLCEDLVAPGGVIANIGVHGTAVDLNLERLWSQNVSITTRLVDTVTTPQDRPIQEARSGAPDYPSLPTGRHSGCLQDL